MTHVQKFATLRSLRTLLSLADIADLVIYTINTTYSNKVNRGRDVELQNTHIVLFKLPRDVHQVATLSVQWVLGSALVEWYRHATSVPFDHFLIDFSLQTDDRLRYCINGGKIPSKCCLPDILKNLKHLDDEHTKSLYSPSIATLFLRIQNSVSKNLSGRIYPTSECIVNLLHENLSEVKRSHVL